MYLLHLILLLHYCKKRPVYFLYISYTACSSVPPAGKLEDASKIQYKKICDVNWFSSLYGGQPL